MKSQHLSLHCTSWQLKLFRRRNNVPVCKLLKTYTHVKREMIHSEERDRCDGGACFERRRSYIHACKTREKNRSLFCLISSTDQEIDLEGAIKIRRKRSAIVSIFVCSLLGKFCFCVFNSVSHFFICMSCIDTFFYVKVA